MHINTGNYKKILEFASTPLNPRLTPFQCGGQVKTLGIRATEGKVDKLHSLIREMEITINKMEINSVTIHTKRLTPARGNCL